MDDQTLLHRYSTTRDAGAFEELVLRHAGLVKATCVRVLGNAHDAEEVSQECFLELARHCNDVHSSVVGWLHRAATSRSLNMLRSRARRRVRERRVGLTTEAVTEESGAASVELERIIATALKDLPDDLRQPMLLHYFDGRSQREVAVELGVNQSTISRRMRDALQYLREKLTQAGYAAASPAIAVFVPHQSALAASGATGSKLALSGTASKLAGGTGSLWTLKSLLAAAISIISYLVFGGWVSLMLTVGLTLYVARSRPGWVRSVFESLGVRDIYNHPTYEWSKWTWTVPPSGWRKEVAFSIGGSLLFLALAWSFALSSSAIPWGAIITAVIAAIGCAVQAARICHRVRFLQRSQSTSEKSIAPAEGEMPIAASTNVVAALLDIGQRIVIGAAGTGTAAHLMTQPDAQSLSPAVLLAGVVGAWMLCTGLTSLWQISGQRMRRRDPLSAASHAVSVETPQAVSTHDDNPRGLASVLLLGVTAVVALSAWVCCNPAPVRGYAISLAAIQTSMLGWILYRVAAHCQQMRPQLIRWIALVVAISCFVLNSGVCLANMFPVSLQ